MKIRNLAFVILSSTIAFSSVAAGDANYTTDRMQKPAIEQVDVNEVLLAQPTSAGETQSATELTGLDPVSAKYGNNNNHHRGIAH